MSTNNYFYVRLKAQSPKQGYNLVRYHFAGHLFQGGARPTWYKVNEQLANLCRNEYQESGRPAFDVVTEDEKNSIDREEEQRRLVSLGLLSATIPTPRAAPTLDIREAPTKAPGRFDAIPEDADSTRVPGVTTAREFGLGAK